MTYLQKENSTGVIKEKLNSIMKQINTTPKARPTNDTKTSVTKIHKLVLSNDNPIERFYFITMLCNLCSSEKPDKFDKLMKLVLPPSATPQSMALISDIISFALCDPSKHGAILDHLSTYLNGSDMIKIYIESWNHATTLAHHSQYFCSALLSRQDLPQMGVPKKLLAKWLQDLSESKQGFPPVNLNQIIKSFLLDGLDCGSSKTTKCTPGEKIREPLDTSDSDLHFCILTLIQSRRCLTLTNQFLIEIANTLSQKVNFLDESKKTVVLDRFGQIISVAAASKATSITTSLKNALSNLDSNQLIAAVIKWQNK
jgi:hypothetical protein